MTTNKQVDRWHRIAEQEEWIEEHGSDLAGYIARYGSERDAIHYGSGGEAIYAADLAQLAALVRDLAYQRGEVPAQFRNNTRRDAAVRAAYDAALVAADAAHAAADAAARTADEAAAAEAAYLAAHAARAANDAYAAAK